MKRVRRAALAALVAMPLAAGAWLGCSSSSSPEGAADGGEDRSAPDAFTPPEPGGDAGPGDTEALTCANYCARVLANCAGDAAQYADLPRCLAVCKDLPLGDAGETASNTVACRMYHAGALAKRSPGFHCPHAGPWGGAVCGTRCGAFCALATAQCPAAFPADAGACDAACGVAFDYTPGAPESPTAPTSGDTLNCREYHLGLAFGDPATHCAHVGPKPAGAGTAFPCR